MRFGNVPILLLSVQCRRRRRRLTAAAAAVIAAFGRVDFNVRRVARVM